MTRMTPDKADQKLELLEKALKDANLVLADMKSTIREGRAMLVEIKKVVADAGEAKVAEAVARSISKLGDATSEAIEEAERGIFKRFDNLFATLMGEDKKSQKMGRPTLSELIEQLPYCLVHKERHTPTQVKHNCEFREGS